jgi:SAM-dependent methyltransferase
LNADFDPARYGDSCATFYDQLYPRIAPGLVSAIVAQAKGGAVLELGVATGSTALALRAAGVDIHGVEASPAMLAQFRARAGTQTLSVIEGDFAQASFGRSYALIFSLVSTLYLLPTVDAQQRCLRNIARHLAPGGRFVSEAFVDPRAETQAQSQQLAIATESGVRSYRVTSLATPLPVLDRLAESAGLVLAARWGDWFGAAYRPGGARHISVYAMLEQ